MSPKTIHIFLAGDPLPVPDEGGAQQRVLAQTTPIGRDDLPPGPRGEGWVLRELEVPSRQWVRMLSGALPPEEQDELHREWWAHAEPSPARPPAQARSVRIGDPEAHAGAYPGHNPRHFR